MGFSVGGLIPSQGKQSGPGKASDDASDSLKGILDEMAKTVSTRKKDSQLQDTDSLSHKDLQALQQFNKAQQKQQQLAQQAGDAADFNQSMKGSKGIEKEAASLLAGLLADEDDIKTKKKGKKTFSENMAKIGAMKAQLEGVKLDNTEEQEVLTTFLSNFERIKNAFSRLKRSDKDLKFQEERLKKQKDEKKI